MASKSFGNIQKSIKDQASRREVMTVYDQHKSARFPNGRPWWGHIEMPSEVGGSWGFVGSLTPGDHNDPFNSAWEAPWMPDAKYLAPDANTGRMTIRYMPMIAEYRERTNKYYHECGEKAFEKGWPAPEPGGLVPWRLRIIAGPMPQSPKIPEAALVGDPWLLGFQTEPNEVLQRILKATAYSDRQTMEGNVDAPDEPPAPQSPADVQAMIDAAVSKALAGVSAAPRRGGTSNIEKARAAKAAKRAAVLASQAASDGALAGG